MDVFRGRKQFTQPDGSTEILFAKSRWDYTKKGKIWVGSGPFRNSLHIGVLGQLKQFVINQVNLVKRDPNHVVDYKEIDEFLQNHILSVTVEQIDLENMVKHETPLASWLVEYAQELITYVVDGRYGWGTANQESRKAFLDIWVYIEHQLTTAPVV